MSDSAYQVFQHYGTNAQRLAFTPNPPTSPTGTQPLYIWFETDTSNTYAYTTGWHLISTSGGLTPPGGSDKDIQYNNAGAFGGIAPGSAGTVLTSNGASSTASFQAAGSGALVLLEQHTASSSASLDFTTAISSTYDTYQIQFLNVLPATTSTSLWMRVSTNGGSSYDSGANYLCGQWGWRAGGSSLGGGGASQTKIVLNLTGAGGISNNTAGTLSGMAQIYNPLGGVTINPQVSGRVLFFDTSGPNFLATDFFGIYGVASAVNAFQFLMSSGNIASGTIRCYGLAK